MHQIIKLNKKFLDIWRYKNMIPVCEPNIGREELENITEAVKSGWISSAGEFVEKFEKEFARFLGVKHAISTSSGTTALHLALSALGVKPGDEVIIPDLTFVATAHAIRHCFAKPVLVDVTRSYWCINPDRIEEKITDKTKAIVPVHLYGNPCDMKPILEIAEKHGLFVVEDAAEALGSEYMGRKVGSFGDIGCFSFYGNKIITTGEGGMCVTNNDDLAERMRLLRNQAMHPKRRYYHVDVGYNYRMTNVQAAIGLAQVRKLDTFIAIKRANARLYSLLLSDCDDIVLHPEEPWAKSTFWMYSVLVDKRDKVMLELKKEGIDTRPFFIPMHQLPPYHDNNGYPASDYLGMHGLNLPSSTRLTDDEVSFVCEKLLKIVGGKR